MTKDELRHKYRQMRANLTHEEVEQMSLNLANQLLKLPVWDKTYYHLFLPITKQKEVNTEYVLQILQGKDKEVVVARSDFETRQMTHFLLTDTTRLVTNRYGIPEPANGLPVPVEAVEVVFVPLLAYDHKGNRIGYGKGFYDLFLSQCNPGTVKIGLSFFEPEPLFEELSDIDIPLDYVVTPVSVYSFGSV